MRIFLAQCNPIVGDIAYNTNLICQAIQEAKKASVDVVVFSELVLCGYSPDDLLLDNTLPARCHEALLQLASYTHGITALVGCIRTHEGRGKPLYNSVCIMHDGKILGYQDKSLLPTYDVFDEWRYFEPATSQNVWEINGKKVGITVCEDIWCTDRYSKDPIEYFEKNKVDFLFNLSASPYSLGKIQERQKAAIAVSTRLNCPVVLVNQVGATDGLLFDGSSFVVSGNALVAQAKSFAPDGIVYDFKKSSLVVAPAFEVGEELFLALSMGVRDYFYKQKKTDALIGLSGGIDSSVVAAIATHALGPKHVHGLFMPSRFTSSQSKEDAYKVASNLEIDIQEYSIEPTLSVLLESLNLGPDFGVTEENLQSRIRGTMLMATANKHDYMVLNTGNKSEIAMGYTTLYGDSVGAIGVLGDLLKHQVYSVAQYVKSMIPEQVFAKAPTAELKHNQKDSDTLPEYPVLDTIVNDHIVHNKLAEEIAKTHGFALVLVQDILKKIHQNEYKRRQLPFALRISEKAFSTGRKVPIVSYIKTN